MTVQIGLALLRAPVKIFVFLGIIKNNIPQVPIIFEIDQYFGVDEALR